MKNKDPSETTVKRSNTKHNSEIPCFRRNDRVSKVKTQIKSVNLNSEDLNVDSTDHNFLQYDQNKLEPFVVKLFSQLEYFKNLSEGQDKFESFLKELHANYETHKNPFHNFTHGINGTPVLT